MRHVLPSVSIDSPALRLHHIGRLVNDLATSAQEMESRLGYILESAIIEDPAQTALVQFLRQPGACLWLELITPNGPGSKLANALRRGGGLHHLCYEVDDIAAACERMREQTMLMLAAPVPAAAFEGRRIAWFMDRAGLLVELLESDEGPLSLASIMPPRGSQ